MTTIYITKGEHFSVPGTPQSVHWDRASAVKAAEELLTIIIAGVNEVYGTDLSPPQPGESEEDFNHTLQITQAIYETDGDFDAAKKLLEELNDPRHPRTGIITDGALDVWIEEHEIAQPRVMITMEGGCINDITADIACRMVVLDYDTEGSSDDLYLIPQEGSEPRKGLLHSYDASIDSYEIDLRLRAEPVDAEATLAVETCTHCGEDRGFSPEVRSWRCGSCGGMNEAMEAGGYDGNWDADDIARASALGWALFENDSDGSFSICGDEDSPSYRSDADYEAHVREIAGLPMYGGVLPPGDVELARRAVAYCDASAAAAEAESSR